VNFHHKVKTRFNLLPEITLKVIKTKAAPQMAKIDTFADTIIKIKIIIIHHCKTKSYK